MSVENRKGCVLGTRRCDPVGLAQIVHCVARHGRHTFGELAQMVGSRSDALSRRTDGLSEDLTLRQAISISVLQGDTRIIEETARRVGGVYVQMPDAHTADDDVFDALSAAVEEIGQDSSAVRHILADRTVTTDEADAADREIDETIAALVRLKAVIRRKVPAAVTPLTAATRRSS